MAIAALDNHVLASPRRRGARARRVGLEVRIASRGRAVTRAARCRHAQRPARAMRT